MLLSSQACLLSIDTSRIADVSATDDAGDAAVGEDADVDPCQENTISVPGSSSALCIDRREVTNTEYARFLDGGVNSAGESCRWNNRLEPLTWPQAPEGASVVDVDWCDALSFCEARGASLCNVTDWFAACASGGFDVNDSVTEWALDCQPGSSGAAQRFSCRVREGRFGDAGSTCMSESLAERVTPAADRGFRCCQVAR